MRAYVEETMRPGVTRVAFDSSELVHLDTSAAVRITVDVSPDQFRALLVGLVDEYRRQGGSDL